MAEVPDRVCAAALVRIIAILLLKRFASIPNACRRPAVRPEHKESHDPPRSCRDCRRRPRYAEDVPGNRQGVGGTSRILALPLVHRGAGDFVSRHRLHDRRSLDARARLAGDRAHRVHVRPCALPVRLVLSGVPLAVRPRPGRRCDRRALAAALPAHRYPACDVLRPCLGDRGISRACNFFRHDR